MKHKRVSWRLLLSIALIAALLVTAFAATGVFASLADTTKRITVKPGSVSCEVDRDYVIRNTGSVPVLLRAKLVVNWVGEDGSILALPPEGAQVSVRTLPGWTQLPADAGAVEEGCWYYAEPLAPNAAVSLIDEILCEGGTARVTVLAEVIQSEPAQAVSEAWGMTYSGGVWR